MKNPICMNAYQINMWLIKTTKRITIYINNGGSINDYHGIMLANLYDHLKDEMLDRGQWDNFCRHNNLEINHCGYTIFAEKTLEKI
jgi:hypothetical protein